MEKKNYSAMATTIVISSLLLLATIIVVIPILFTPSPVANGQPERPLPVLLIHGYRSTHNVWDEWEEKLDQIGISTKSVTFPRNDECGNATDHAIQLNKLEHQMKDHH